MTIVGGSWQEGVEKGFTWTWCEEHQCPLEGGVCERCLKERNPYIQVFLSEMDLNALDWDSNLTVRDLLPAGELGDWLLGRILGLAG